MTVYNEAEYVEYAIRSVLPYVDDLVIVEGAYQETIALGASPRSTDGTREIIHKTVCDDVTFEEFVNGGVIFRKDCAGVYYIEVNEKTDKDQRNVGLEVIKKINPNGWLLIVDGDEIYNRDMLAMVKITANNMARTNKYAAYFRSITFINDLKHYADQDFPRLFRITPECKFINDNFMQWSDEGVTWFLPYILRMPYIRYWHYAFAKGLKRFELKRDWWNNRELTDKNFEYDWYVGENGKLYSPNHNVYEYTGQHPEIMKEHPRWKECYGTEEEI
ncbi:MAG: glycosyltransferase family 2 protein [Asgard group archaeon]|nr:glycosyltransferase family 2 protein [Asgard group archaeon]